MQTKTVIAYIPGKKAKKRSKSWRLGQKFAKVRKFMLLGVLLFVYLIYTNQSSTLGYSLRSSLSELEVAQDALDDLELEVGQQEQQLRSSVERIPNKTQTKKIIVN